ncbi:MAG: type II secretion system protein [Bacilli bacterium]|nr:type II secretion system protein [Bacilli bacterium]
MFKRKKLNNKGFTLIELLAVIVILAVVMGVATMSVLNAMNNSRESSLKDSALSAADAFRTAYAEYSLNPSNGILGVTTDASLTSLLNGNVVPLNTFKDGLNITVGSNTENYLEASAVKFNKDSSSFTVCLVANSKGSYYVARDAKNTAPPVVNGTLSGNNMWACSNNQNSWNG